MQKRSDTKLLPAGLPVQDVAPFIGVSEATVWRMLRDGTLPRMKLRGRTVVPRSACEALLAHQG